MNRRGFLSSLPALAAIPILAKAIPDPEPEPTPIPDSINDLYYIGTGWNNYPTPRFNRFITNLTVPSSY